MIANISTVLYIISTCEQHFSNKVLQTGSAACKIDTDGDFLNFRYTSWLPLDSTELDDNDIENLYVHKFNQDSVYFITGKFTILDNGLLELVVSSCKSLPIDKEKIPVCKPIVYLLGRVKDACNVTDSGYHMTMEIKPYLAAEMCGPVDVVLTHPLEGRLKNTFTAAKKSSTIQCTAELFVIENKLYCDVIEMQFINLKSESSSVPWSVTNKDNKDKKKSPVANRIVAVHKAIQKQPPTSNNAKSETAIKEKGASVKVDNIAREIIKRKREKAADGDIEETTVIDKELEVKKKNDEAPQPKRGRPKRR